MLQFPLYFPTIFMKLSKSKITLIAIIGIAVLGALWVWSSYNGLIRAKASLDTSWAQVETQYQRRFDLIPNLQATVQGAVDFEQETFIKVTEARTQWQSAGTQSEKISAAGSFDSALSRLLVTVENYPDLKATQNFRDFQVQLEGTENRIAVARKDFNESVRSYNVFIRVFPRNFLANAFGYQASDFFESAGGSENAPSVEF